MSENSYNDYHTSDTESIEEEIEPKLKYSRLRNDLAVILLTDAASCIGVHPKFICVGSHWGALHILDHQGNSIEDIKLTTHTVAVNQIAIESNGDYIASCSDDGKVFVQGLYAGENTSQHQQLNVGRLVKTIALDPGYSKSGSGKRFIAGDDKLTLYEKTFLGRTKITVLSDSEGLVRALAWGEQFVAWASDIGVRVYDMSARRSLGLIKWEQQEGIAIEQYRCNLRWSDSRTLLIGWVNTVRVCVIRRRNNSELANRDLAEYLVDPYFFICGIAPLPSHDRQLVVLGYPRLTPSSESSFPPSPSNTLSNSTDSSHHSPHNSNTTTHNSHSNNTNNQSNIIHSQSNNSQNQSNNSHNQSNNSNNQSNNSHSHQSSNSHSHQSNNSHSDSNNSHSQSNISHISHSNQTQQAQHSHITSNYNNTGSTIPLLPLLSGARPQLYVLEYRDNGDYTEVCCDSLTLRGYEAYQPGDYHLAVLEDESRFFIVAPKDVVVASPYELDDRIQWLMQHSKFDEAITAIRQSEERGGTGENRFTIEKVGTAYLDHLLAKCDFELAGKLCQQIFGKNEKLWEEEIFKFATLHQLRSVSPYIPRTLDCKLNPHIYEMVLYEYLKMDSQGFLNLVKEWNCQLYNISAVINAVLEHLVVSDVDKNIHLEALAMLYSYEKKYDRSLSMYLKLKHNDVFDLIRKHKLYNAIHDMIIDLMEVDLDKTISMLLEKNKISPENRIPPEVVVEKLKAHEWLLYKYLDALDRVNSRIQYHGKLVKLYAKFEREKLLQFLRRSDHYPIEEALDICDKAKYYPEMVYLLDRIGDTKEALQLITSQLGDMPQAITFCQQHNDPELWQDLILHAHDKPDAMTFLLRTIGTYMDPTPLIQQVREDMRVPGLRGSLVTMLCTYNLQVSVQEGCKKILISDYFNLHKKLVNNQQKGIYVSEELLCGACHQIILKIENASNVIVYNCNHLFHETCLPDNIDKSSCGVCYQAKTT